MTFLLFGGKLGDSFELELEIAITHRHQRSTHLHSLAGHAGDEFGQGLLGQGNLKITPVQEKKP